MKLARATAVSSAFASRNSNSNETLPDTREGGEIHLTSLSSDRNKETVVT
jgi:hypothetical protein